MTNVSDVFACVDQSGQMEGVNDFDQLLAEGMQYLGCADDVIGGIQIFLAEPAVHAQSQNEEISQFN